MLPSLEVVNIRVFVFLMSLVLFFATGFFAGRIGNRDIYTYPITVYAPHTPDTIPMFLTLDGVAVHCFFEDR
ncbi:hypothetical protein LCGC14_1896390 [marine sediment metagenome]|uniref:Uncharacterized protein n=1 Tax=marine sediment metagenome TaxID=412755 RepID=A0A0F9GLC7_9ZZZZ